MLTEMLADMRALSPRRPRPLATARGHAAAQRGHDAAAAENAEGGPRLGEQGGDEARARRGRGACALVHRRGVVQDRVARSKCARSKCARSRSTARSPRPPSSDASASSSERPPSSCNSALVQEATWL